MCRYFLYSATLCRRSPFGECAVVGISSGTGTPTNIAATAEFAYSFQLPSSCRALNEDMAGLVAVDAQQTPCEMITKRILVTSWWLVSLNSYCLQCPSALLAGDRLLCEEHDPPEAPKKLIIQEPAIENPGILRIVQALLKFQV